MAKKAWAAFAHPSKAFEYDGAKLARAWPVLHAGDLEPFPDEKRVAALLRKNPKLGKRRGRAGRGSSRMPGARSIAAISRPRTTAASR